MAEVLTPGIGSQVDVRLDPRRLAALAASLAERYRTAEPFPHVVIDDFLTNDVLSAVLEEFPLPSDPRWRRFDRGNERKLAWDNVAECGPVTRRLLAEFNSSPCVDFLERLTGITGLIPDPHFVGGGLHQIESGGYLKIHADFNRHDRLSLDRRLNLLLFLNHDWRDEYGGHLEFWDRSMSTAVVRIAPIFNRCAIFSTTDFAFHGHPVPLACPDEVTRKSLALYYYSNGRPREEVGPRHTTTFLTRPGERPGRMALRDFTRDLLPPVLTRAIRRIRRG